MLKESQLFAPHKNLALGSSNAHNWAILKRKPHFRILL